MLLGFYKEFLKLSFFQDYICMNHEPESAILYKR